MAPKSKQIWFSTSRVFNIGCSSANITTRGVQVINFFWQIWTSTMFIGAQRISLVKEGALTKHIRKLWDFFLCGHRNFVPILLENYKHIRKLQDFYLDISSLPVIWHLHWNFEKTQIYLPQKLLCNRNSPSFASYVLCFILFCCKIWTSGMLIGAAEPQNLAQKVQFFLHCSVVQRKFIKLLAFFVLHRTNPQKI